WLSASQLSGEEPEDELVDPTAVDEDGFATPALDAKADARVEGETALVDRVAREADAVETERREGVPAEEPHRLRPVAPAPPLGAPDDNAQLGAAVDRIDAVEPAVADVEAGIAGDDRAEEIAPRVGIPDEGARVGLGDATAVQHERPLDRRVVQPVVADRGVVLDERAQHDPPAFQRPACHLPMVRARGRRLQPPMCDARG